MLNLNLAEKTVAITGISSAFGAAIARLLTDQEVKLFGCDIAPAEEGRLPRGTDFATVDLCDREAATTWVKEVENKSGGAIDILIHNAGGPLGIPFSPIEDVKDTDWDGIIAANLGAVFAVTRAAAAAMKAQKSGRIITITSGAGLKASLTGLQAYCSAKHAVVGLTRQLAAEFGPYGITVNSVAPGLQMTSPVKQARWESYGEDRQARILSGIAMRRLGTPEDIAKAVLFFSSSLSDFVTGEILSVTGGSAS